MGWSGAVVLGAEEHVVTWLEGAEVGNVAAEEGMVAGGQRGECGTPEGAHGGVSVMLHM